MGLLNQQPSKGVAFLLVLCTAAGLLTGCPLSNKARVSFTAAPDRGYAALTVNFHASVVAVPPYVIVDKFRGDGIPGLIIISYMWTFGDGSAGSGAHPIHVYNNPGTYDVTLRALVREEDTGTSSMTPPFHGKVVVLARNVPPVADAGPDQALHAGEQAQLDGSGSSDADGDALTYAWSFVSVPGEGTVQPSAAQLDDPTAMTPSFFIDQPGSYVLQLIVNDGQADSTPDTMTITTTNAPPVANAGPDQNLVVGRQVALDGRASSDPDGDPITYAWRFVSVPGGSKWDGKTALNDPTSPTPTFIADRAGDFVVQLIVNDGELNSAPDTVTIGAVNQPPVIFTSLGGGTELAMTLECGEPFVPPEVNATDAAGNDITGRVITGGDTVDGHTPGVYVVTYDVTDLYGNTAPTVTVTVTVEDTTPPVVIARNITVGLGADGTATINTEDVDAGSSDNCGLTLTVSPSTFTCADLGPHEVTLTGTDLAEHVGTATAVVTIVDTQAPVAAAKAITVQLDENGLASISAVDVDNGSTDNCDVSLSISPNAFTCADTSAPVTVVLTAVDPSGNSATAQAAVTVMDNIAPMARAKSITVALDVNGQANIAAADVDNGSADNCDVSLSISPNAFTCADTGAPVTVVLTAVDPSGNSATAQAAVTVVDNIAPMARAKDIVVQLDANGQTGIVAADVDNGSADNCDVSLSVSPNAFTCADTGAPATVVLTAVDPSGNSATAQAAVTVVDNITPVARAKDIVVQLDANGQAAITGADVDDGSSDNCSLNLSVTPNTFTCADLTNGQAKAVNVTLTAVDPGGNSATAQATVTIVDSIAPAARAKNITVALDANGQASITAADVDNGSADNCDVSLSVSPNAFTCADTGAPVIVTLTAVDPSGNSDTAQAAVTVADNMAPVARTKNITVPLNANGQASITAADVDNGSTDNCSVILGVSPDIFTCADVTSLDENKSVTVTLTATDPSGNSDTAPAMVTVVDNIAPVAAAKDITVQLNANGQANIAAEDIDDGSTDNCAVSLSVFPNTFTCADLAGDLEKAVMVTLTAVDPSGNSDTAQAMVTVVDNIAPVAAARDITVQLDANGQASIAAADIDDGSADNCTVSLSVFPDTFSCMDVDAPVPVTLTVADSSGNSDTAEATVTVVDSIAPVAAAKDITVEVDENGAAGITAADVDNGSADNCELTLSVDPDTLGCTDTPVTVILTATDLSGNTDTAEATVTVVDALPPKANARNTTVHLDANGQASIEAEDVDSLSSDNCDFWLNVYPATFTCADTGAPVTVTLTATDLSGNSDTDEALITVEDTRPPAAVAKDITVQLDASGQATITGADVDDGSTDNCSVILSVSPDTFTCEDVSLPGKDKAVVVTLTAEDPSGNSDTAEAIVTVEDTIAPVAAAKNITVQLDANGEASITAGDVDDGSSDNCSVSLFVFPDTFTCEDVDLPEKAKSVPVTLTAFDPSGNSDTADVVVTVVDSIAPTVIAKNITIQLDGSSQASITAQDVDNGSSDNCSVNLSVFPYAFTCADVGTPVTVTLTGTDPSGNSDTATALVTVVDPIPPVAVADPSTSLMFFLDENGAVTITPEDIDMGSEDNCSVELSVSPNSFTCDDIGNFIVVTLTATDPSGNTDTDTSMIMILDGVYPTAVAKDILVELDENGQASITAADVDDGSSDNCSVQLSVAPDTFTCDDLYAPAKAPVPVTLTATDPMGLTDTAEAYVTVVDLLPPVITLNGDAVVVLACGDSYVEEGATAEDNCPTEFFIDIDASAVNPNIAGNYQVSYDTEDYSGNAAETVYRTVIVVGDCGECLDSETPPGTPAFCYGFESDLDGFTLEDYSTLINLWHRTDVCPALSVPNGSSWVLYFGQDTTCNYDVPFEMMEGYANSPQIDLTEATGPVLLSFSYALETGEGGYSDYASVFITADGENYDVIASSSIEYPDGAYKLCDDGPPPQYKADSGEKDPPLWHTAVIDLSAYVGNIVNLQFAFSAWDGSLNDKLGFAVDDICIHDYSPPSPAK